MKMFIVSTDNRNPDDFETWVVGAFNSLEDAKNAAIRSVEIPCSKNQFIKNFKIVKSWESFSDPTFTDFKVSWEMDGKNGKHTGVDVFRIQTVETGAIYDEDMKEIKEA